TWIGTFPWQATHMPDPVRDAAAPRRRVAVSPDSRLGWMKPADQPRTTPVSPIRRNASDRHLDDPDDPDNLPAELSGMPATLRRFYAAVTATRSRAVAATTTLNHDPGIALEPRPGRGSRNPGL